VVTITRKSDDDFECVGTFEADAVQACVVTLEPVPSHLEGEYRRSYRLAPKLSKKYKKASENINSDISHLDKEGAEMIDSPMLDLAAPLLEELTLALDPYPRAQAPRSKRRPKRQTRGNPFAVLEQLKRES
jgi:uncharacterized metal-binding protein YceD (DUF177 family)